MALLKGAIFHLIDTSIIWKIRKGERVFPLWVTNYFYQVIEGFLQQLQSCSEGFF